MSTMYDRINELCKKNHTNVTEMCRKLKIGRSSLSELSRGRSKQLNADSTTKIAEYFGVSPRYLTDGMPEKFAKYYIPYNVREILKADNRAITSNKEKYSLEERVDAQIRILQCLFARSYESQGFNPNHVTFEDYIAMTLNQGFINANISKDVYDILVLKYGTKKGMSQGSCAYISNETDVDINSNNATSVTLSAHEKTLISAYRDQPEMQPAVDKLLGIDLIAKISGIKTPTDKTAEAAREGNGTHNINIEDLESTASRPSEQE